MKLNITPIKFFMSLSLVICCGVGVAVAEEGKETEKEQNYYLEQMRNQSQIEAGKPDQTLPEQEEAGLFAESDLQDLTKTDEDLTNIEAPKPEFDMPKLGTFKPQL